MSKRLRVILLLVFTTLSVFTPVLLLAAEQVDGNFSLELVVNGENLSTLEAITIDPEENITIDLHISNVKQEVILESISVTITFIEQPIISITKSLNSVSIETGGEYFERINVDPKDAIGIGDMTLATGMYNGFVTLDYSIAGKTKTFSQPKNINTGLSVDV
jgi:hypothetical protein